MSMYLKKMHIHTRTQSQRLINSQVSAAHNCRKISQKAKLFRGILKQQENKNIRPFPRGFIPANIIL